MAEHYQHHQFPIAAPVLLQINLGKSGALDCSHGPFTIDEPHGRVLPRRRVRACWWVTTFFAGLKTHEIGKAHNRHETVRKFATGNVPVGTILPMSVLTCSVTPKLDDPVKNMLIIQVQWRMSKSPHCQLQLPMFDLPWRFCCRSTHEERRRGNTSAADASSNQMLSGPAKHMSCDCICNGNIWSV